MAGSRHRERRIIAAVPCPVCGAAVGAPCRLGSSDTERATSTGRLLVHGVRRAAWQTWKRSRPVDIYVRAGQTFQASTEDAWGILQREAQRIAPHQQGLAGPQAIVIQPSHAGELVLALTRAGLRVE